MIVAGKKAVRVIEAPGRIRAVYRVVLYLCIKKAEHTYSG